MKVYPTLELRNDEALGMHMKADVSHRRQSD